MDILEIKKKIKENLLARKNTDDDKFVVPEVVDYDMYGLEYLSTLNLNGEILDCGAHIGAFSVYAAELFPNNKIVSFEPNPDNFKLLIKNTESYSNIEANQKAVGIKSEKLKLYLPSDESKTGRFTLSPDVQSSKKYIEVDVIDLIEYIENSGGIAILKLDLEGFEADIIKKFTKKTLDKIQMLFIEEHHNAIDLKLIEEDFQLIFKPFNHDRHYVYYKKNNDYKEYQKLVEVINKIEAKNYKRAIDEVFADRNKYMFKLQKLENSIFGWLIKLIK